MKVTIIQAIVAIIVVGGAVASVFVDDTASRVLMPVATAIVAYLFKGSGIDVALRAKMARKPKPKK